MQELKVVWAYDPYTESEDAWNVTIETIKNLAEGGRKVSVTPVYVLGQEMVHWVSNVTPPQLKLIEPSVRNMMAEQISGFNLSQLEDPVVLLSEGLSRREDVDVLNNYLKEAQPDLVLINTHQRTGMSRLFMGSFTESFLLKSQFPSYVIPPNMEHAKKVTKTLFPTSFNASEEKFYEALIGGDMGFKTDVVLYSKVFHPIDAFAQSVSTALGGGWVSLEAYSKDVIGQRMNQGEAWVQKAKDKGVNVTVKVDDAPKDFVDSIVDLAKSEGAQLIALPSFAGNAEAVLLGSNAREVIRMSQLPVLVKHYPES